MAVKLNVRIADTDQSPDGNQCNCSSDALQLRRFRKARDQVNAILATLNSLCDRQTFSEESF
jgi:hypothetical protein